MLAHSFFIESSSKLLVTRTGIKALVSMAHLYVFQKWDLTLPHWTQVSDRCPLGYLLAHLSQMLAHHSQRLTRWAYSIPMARCPSVVHTFKLEYLRSQLASLDQILHVASLGWGKGYTSFWGRLDKNSGFHATESPHWRIMGKTMSPPFLGCFYLILFILADNEDMHKI